MGWPGKKNGRPASQVHRPLARTDELVVEDVEREVLVYDKRTDEAHCLSPAAAQVWRACDGKTSCEQLAAQLELDAGTVRRALDELEACGLLDGIVNHGVTRRQAATRFAKVGAAAAAAPLIYSVVGPIPEAAATLTAQCQAVNSAVGGHDCGTQAANPVGCKSIAGCCCCHAPGPPLIPGVCSGDTQHCCTSAAGCAAAGGGPCS
jgi:hypothetical protein